MSSRRRRDDRHSILRRRTASQVNRALSWVTKTYRRRRRARRNLLCCSRLAAFILVVVPAPGRAQQAPPYRVEPELRADVTFGLQSSIDAGGGVQIPVGRYTRLGVTGAVGLVRPFDVFATSGVSSRITSRVDVLARFLLDPFRQSPLGMSVGAGVSLRTVPRERVRPQFFVALDVEGRRRSNGVTPALQIGIGGGLRVGGIIRWGAERTR